MYHEIKIKKGDRYKINVGDIDVGWFTIESIKGDRVKIKYEKSGITSDLSKKYIVNNVSKEFRNYGVVGAHNSDEVRKLHAKTMGFLCANCEVIALIPDKDVENFNKSYYELLGESPNENNPSYQIHQGDAWSSTIRLSFKIPKGLGRKDFWFGRSNELDLKVGSGKGVSNINSISYGFDLLDMGFSIGKDHNINEVKSNIQKEYINYFEEGFNM